MAGLTFNPAFHSAVLNTLREGVIHLALPEPEIAQRPDFSSVALRNLLGVSEDDSLKQRFQAAADFIRFAARYLPESDRPAELAHLWMTGRGPRTEDTLMEGVLRFLEETTGEAREILGENAFRLSLNVWNEPDDPSHRFVLLDHLEENGQASPEQRFSLDVGLRIEGEKDRSKKRSLERKRETLRTSFSKTFQKHFKSASVYGLPAGFANASHIWRDHVRMLRRLQLLQETRFLATLDLSQHSYMSGLSNELFIRYPNFFLRRLKRFGWTSFGDRDVPAIAAMLPKSQLSVLDLNCTRLDENAARAVAAALPRSQITDLYIGARRPINTVLDILEEAGGRSGTQISFYDLT